MCTKRSRVFFGSCVATSAVIESKPGLLCRGEFLIAYSTSLGRTCLGGRVIGSGQDRKWFTFSIHEKYWFHFVDATYYILHYTCKYSYIYGLRGTYPKLPESRRNVKNVFARYRFTAATANWRYKWRVVRKEKAKRSVNDDDDDKGKRTRLARPAPGGRHVDRARTVLVFFYFFFFFIFIFSLFFFSYKIPTHVWGGGC